MSIDLIREFIRQKAEEFGAKTSSEFNRPYVERNNTKHDALQDNGAYFGFIHPDEEVSGPFHDFSLTIFPSEDKKPWLVCLGIGSLGFKNDYELSTYPGVRRLFAKLVNENGFCKSDFSDIETSLPRSITQHERLAHIKNTIRSYSKVLPVCQIVDKPDSENGRRLIAAFVAGYAKLRNWATNASHRKAIDEALASFVGEQPINHETHVLKLLQERKFVVLQGPPGTGKTRLAKLVAEKMQAKIFFTQFHAETSYSDFVYGIRPDVASENLTYREKRGVLADAIAHSQSSKARTVLLIDEINRANLANVLGPTFYLFEHKQDISNVSVEVAPNLSVEKIPDNFYVIATMNTADRSLAVVDFALRRRFAWYTLRPEQIKSAQFFQDDFDKLSSIFQWHATSSELSIQPGQAYFLAKSEEEMENRIRYEIYPLIKEYLQEGLLRSAKEEFNEYFMTRINTPLFE